MINYYTGVPGSGKSYHMAVDIYNYLSSGKNVISNFKVNDFMVNPKHKNKILGNFIYVSNDEWLTNAYRRIGGSSKDLKEYSYINGLINYARNFHKYRLIDGDVSFYEHQTLLVFDECHVIWNSRQWNRSDRLRWLDFFAEHRKLGFDMILISQEDKNIDKQIRARLETEIFHRKFFNYVKPKFLGSFFRLLFGRELFICIERKYGMASKKDAHYRSYYVWGKKKYYDFYNTSEIFAFNLDADFVGAINATSAPIFNEDGGNLPAAASSAARDRVDLWRETLTELGYDPDAEY